ncbi:MAG: T9SS type A sorting domain-containing protein [Bacteroidales bacterium]|nr:T9SS type A sorting domain-containing protein [Bacteroidales bacterium]
MKRKLQFMVMLIALITGSSIAQVAYFPFDEDAIDANQEINSTAESAGVSFVADNYRGSVMEFDGSAGFVTFGSNDVFNFDALTYNLWFRWTTSVADQWWVRLFDFGLPSDMPDHPGNHDVVFATLYQDGLMAWHIHSVDWTDGSDSVLWSKEPIALNEWYMFTYTHDVDSAKLYLNGELQDACDVNDKAPSDFSFLNMYLGKSNWPDALYTGKLDDFAVYDEVLDQAAITALYTFLNVPSATEGLKSDANRIFAYDKTLVVEVQEVNTNTSVSVYSLLGSEIMRQSGFGNRVEINSLQSGVYIVRLTNGSQLTTRKVYIQ